MSMDCCDRVTWNAEVNNLRKVSNFNLKNQKVFFKKPKVIITFSSRSYIWESTIFGQHLSLNLEFYYSHFSLEQWNISYLETVTSEVSNNFNILILNVIFDRMPEMIVSSWADEIEEDDFATLPAPTEKVIGDTKISTEYTINADGKKTKIVRTFKVVKKMVPKVIAHRKQWEKFGMSRNDRPGPDPSTTVVTDEIFMTVKLVVGILSDHLLMCYSLTLNKKMAVKLEFFVQIVTVFYLTI